MQQSPPLSLPTPFSTPHRTMNEAHYRLLKVVQSICKSVDHFQDDLDYLMSEWNTIRIIYESMRNAYETALMVADTQTDWIEVDKELTVSYDDLMAQVRHLDRRLQKLTMEIKQTLSSNLIKD
ncbi:hypothetical protein BDF20DRAFT_883420 [Mycotypha africana]|uniref:uncharacterized protein n=1 Tax=Mycotypha africana TaxID=64632 RepID=UPI0022FFDDD4|nr:uncharacterized protein BDF20DRAFT_883420 [Mycotypha africana]KAI8973650.1 hypothetical protein BDF20DRAFT_883420 [Mycotypha africana]